MDTEEEGGKDIGEKLTTTTMMTTNDMHFFHIYYLMVIQLSS
jgi:hypothetical protein